MTAERGNLADPRLIAALQSFVEAKRDPYVVLGLEDNFTEADKEVLGLASYAPYSPEYLAQKIILEQDNIHQLYIKIFQEHFYQTRINDIRRDYQTLKQSTKARLAEMSHKLGISGEVLHLWGADKADLEGSIEPLSFLWLSESAKRAKEIMGLSLAEKSCFDKVQNAYAMNVEYLVTTQPYVDKYQQGELVVIPGGWKGHAVGVALIDGRLIWTNTGEGSTAETSGTYICKIADKSKIDADFIKKLTQCANQAEFMDAIHAVVLPNPIFIAAKPQKVGSCTFSNHKKNLRGILPCLMALERRSAAEVSDLSDAEITAMIPRSQQIYKKSTVQIRDDALQDLIKVIQRYQSPTFSQITDQKEHANLWIGIATLSANYIDQHFRKIIKKREAGEQLSYKDKEDLARMVKLYQFLPEVIRLKIKTEVTHIADFIAEVGKSSEAKEESQVTEEKPQQKTEKPVTFSPLLQARKERAHKNEMEFFDALCEILKKIPEIGIYCKEILFNDRFKKEEGASPLQIKMKVDQLKEISKIYAEAGSFKPELEALKQTLESFNCKVIEVFSRSPKNFFYAWQVETANHFVKARVPPTQEDVEKCFKDHLEKLKPADRQDDQSHMMRMSK